ncbi:MAG: hypothetical protein IPM56_01515 [Ignavibacteriales bacterium]|nr:MAG: hypothetical protein IPM56_01515 [Ignavibacteriales bacterium]
MNALNKVKENLFAQIFVVYTRYLIGGALVFASLIKIKGYRFTTLSGENEPINSAWHFFETMYQSGLYWKFIGLGQLAAGFLLMTQRYSKPGALLAFPITSNIFVITISYYFALTPVITGMMLLANCILIFWEWNELKILFNLKPEIENKTRFEKDITWQLTGLGLFLFTFIYRVIVDYYNIFFWGIICVTIGGLGLIIGLTRKKNYKKA